MIMPPTAAGGRSSGDDFGTMLEIQSVKMLHDGRSMVETRGIYPFRIIERGTVDGYMVAKIDRCTFSPFFNRGARGFNYSFFGQNQKKLSV
jgi:Lon protease-like protein